MTHKELREAIGLLTPYQVSELSKMAMKYLALNKELQETRPECCPKCGEESTVLIKKGFSRGKQRYQCKCCGRKFTYDTMQVTSHSHQPADAWIIALEDTLAMTSLDDTAYKLEIAHSTAFHMRHKLLVYLESIVEDRMPLSALIEADETYVPESQKGVKVTHRAPRRHGEGASKRGISNEQLCICVATDRNYNVVAKSVNRARPSAADIERALEAHIDDGSVIMCDGSQSYNGLVEHTHSKKVELISHESYDKVYHLNTVNSLHSRFKDMMRQYRGVATKYLNRYAALFTLLAQSITMSFQEAADRIRCILTSRRQYVTINSAKTLGLLEI